MNDFEILRERLKKAADRQNRWPEEVPVETKSLLTLKLATPPLWDRSAGSLRGPCKIQLSQDLLTTLRTTPKGQLLESVGIGIVSQSDTPHLVLQCVDFSMHGFRWKCDIGLSNEEFFSVEQHLSGIDPTNGGHMSSMLTVAIKGYDCERLFHDSAIDFSFRVKPYKVLVGGRLVVNEFAPALQAGE